MAKTKNTQTKNIQIKSIFKKFIACTLALIFVGGITAGILCTGFASRDENGKWFKNSNLSTWHWADKLPDNVGTVPDTPDNPGADNISSAGGAIISDIKCNGGISLLSAVLPREAYAANGIDAQAETAFTLNATITPSSADDKRVEWTVTDKSGTLNASDYITLNASGLTATIACKQAFDHQFTVTVKSLDNPEAIATCTLDYVQRVTGVTVNMPKLTSTMTAITYSVEGSKYTIKSEYSVKFNNFIFDPNNKMKNLFEDEFENEFRERPICLLPDYTYRIVKYTANGVEFENGNDAYITSVDGNDDIVIPSGLVGCFYAIPEQGFVFDLYDEGDVISCFRSAVAQTSIGTVDITVTSTYNGATINALTKSIEIWIDGASLHIPVTGISLDNSSILF